MEFAHAVLENTHLQWRFSTRNGISLADLSRGGPEVAQAGSTRFSHSKDGFVVSLNQTLKCQSWTGLLSALKAGSWRLRGAPTSIYRIRGM